MLDGVFHQRLDEKPGNGDPGSLLLHLAVEGQALVIAHFQKLAVLGAECELLLYRGQLGVVAGVAEYPGQLYDAVLQFLFHSQTVHGNKAV